MSNPTMLPAWKKLQQEKARLSKSSLRDLFSIDPERFNRHSRQLNDLLFDYSKNLVDAETLDLLFQLADQADLRGQIDAMFNGDRVNCTEKRAALHTALRKQAGQQVHVDSSDIMPLVLAEREKMASFSNQVRSGLWRGYNGKQITDVVNIGIGGSDLGPRMVTEALKPFADGPRCHFVSNVDPGHICRTLKGLNPETSLFLIASKTFTTRETLANAQSAKQWLIDAAGDSASVKRHFIAISSNREQAIRFGIDLGNVFEFWDWVGGRYSLWGAIGLSITLSLGMKCFSELLDGARLVDEHFRTEPWQQNIPVLMGLIGIWNCDFLEIGSHAILPYDQNMQYLPAYLQQLDMESNGKRVTCEGETVDWQTGPIIWGEPGTNGQHAFYQLIHQGTRQVSCDFLGAANSQSPLGEQHEILLANMLAQSKALMLGKSSQTVRQEMEEAGHTKVEIEQLLPHRTLPGNRPSNTFLYRQLDPHTLGMLIALYEHKVFVQAMLWGINPFDQWGVELGKHLAQQILPSLKDKQVQLKNDASTNGLILKIRELKT